MGSPKKESDKSDTQIKDKYNLKTAMIPITQEQVPDKQNTVRKAPTMRDIFRAQYPDPNDKATDANTTGILAVFKYTQPSNAKCLFIFGLIVATINGGIGATHAIILADLIDSFNVYQNDQDQSEHLKNTLFKVALPFSGAMLLLGYI